MDNVTHTLIGITLGGAAACGRPERKRAMAWTGMLSSNLPDLDIVLPQALIDGKLGYLLHHRGYTHTLLFAVPLGLFSAWIVARLTRTPFDERRGLYLLGIVGALIHVFSDSWNEYGVHPFFPFVDRWYYGDFLFIVEPLLWLALIPLAWTSAGSRATRFAWGALAGLILALSWSGTFMAWPVAALASVFAACAWFLQRRWNHAGTAALLAVGVLLSFFTASRLARDEVTQRWAKTFPGERIFDLGTGPLPANPLCWRIIVGSVDGSDRYILRVGTYSLRPGWIAPDRCMSRRFEKRTARLLPIDSKPESDLRWEGRFEAPLSELEQMHAGSCAFSAFLRFARFPFWDTRGESSYAGDLRFDREEGAGFSEFDWKRGADTCPRFPVDWTPPLETRGVLVKLR